jgi:hypothetical protein
MEQAQAESGSRFNWWFALFLAVCTASAAGVCWIVYEILSVMPQVLTNMMVSAFLALYVVFMERTRF